MIVIYRCLHFLLNRINTVQIFNIVHNIKYYGSFCTARRQRTSDLLLIYNRRNRGAKQNNATNSVYMNTLIQHINAKKKFQMFAFIFLKIRKCSACFGIIRICRVNMRFTVNPCKPFRRMRNHFSHMLGISAKNNVFSGLIDHMPCKYLIEPVRLIKSPSERFQEFLCFVPRSLAFYTFNTALIHVKVVLIGKNRKNIFGRM